MVHVAQAAFLAMMAGLDRGDERYVGSTALLRLLQHQERAIRGRTNPSGGRESALALYVWLKGLG